MPAREEELRIGGHGDEHVDSESLSAAPISNGVGGVGAVEVVSAGHLDAGGYQIIAAPVLCVCAWHKDMLPFLRLQSDMCSVIAMMTFPAEQLLSDEEDGSQGEAGGGGVEQDSPSNSLSAPEGE